MVTRWGVGILSVCLGVSTAGAFELLRVDGNPCGTTPNFHWLLGGVPVDTSHLDPPSRVAVADEARNRWNDSLGGFQFSMGSGQPCAGTDGVSTLSASSTACSGTPFGDAVAITLSRFRTRTGELVDADVAFDATNPVLDDEAVFLEVAVHELGHVLGLAHSDVCGRSGAGTIMKTTIRLAEARLDRPQPDDIAGADFVYPTDPRRGDANDDDAIDSEDVPAVVGAIFTGIAAGSADVNADTHYSAADLPALVDLLNRLSG